MKETGTKAKLDDGYVQRMPRLSAEETARLGKEIYERDIRHKVEKDHVGEICVIDVESGCWAVGEEEVLPGEPDLLEQLRKQRPEAIEIWLERVGYKALRSFGAGSLRRTD